ncbi:hypothetical protein [Synechococcus elongatus]|uniref:DUF4145 domain-containing protein n=1 Tax=Synechococcus elongatus PCC 11801 TaxID=2219813 RepID=A0AAN1QPZ9_SYNEL|nr:hypothetical protein [Synechococcus elongatus]AZB73363.1 hypothetical protein DOP62_12160 [Synechococcus elongatus PCC 11801]
MQATAEDSSVNFEFLKPFDYPLYNYALLAEKIHQLTAADPCLCQLRLFSEHLANVIATQYNLERPRKKRWNQAQLLENLRSQQIIEGRIYRLLQWFRETGNKACHCNEKGVHLLNDLPDRFTPDDSLEGLQKAQELGAWYIQACHSQEFVKPVFKPLSQNNSGSTDNPQPSLEELNRRVQQLEASLSASLRPYLLRQIDFAVEGLGTGVETGKEHLKTNPWDIFGASKASSAASTTKMQAMQAELDSLLE